MAFPVSPINGATTLVNGINYVYSSTTNSWTRQVASLGNLTVAGNVNADTIYTIQGLYWANNNQPVVGGGINMTVDSNPPAGAAVGDQWYDTVDGILFEYLNDGTSQQWVDITSASIASNSVINLSSGDFSILGHITPGLNTVYDLGNVSYQWRDLYVGGVSTLSNVASALGYFWANGAPAFYSNTWVGQYLENYTGNLAAGNANVTSRVTAGNISTTSGVFWANGAPYTAGRQATSYSMNMIFGI
jgi:hypothetical protein